MKKGVNLESFPWLIGKPHHLLQLHKHSSALYTVSVSSVLVRVKFIKHSILKC